MPRSNEPPTASEMAEEAAYMAEPEPDESPEYSLAVRTAAEAVMRAEHLLSTAFQLVEALTPAERKQLTAHFKGTSTESVLNILGQL